MKKSLNMLLFMVTLGWLLVTPAFAAYQQPLAIADEELESTAGHILPVDAHSQDALAAATGSEQSGVASGVYYPDFASEQTDNGRSPTAYTSVDWSSSIAGTLNGVGVTISNLGLSLRDTRNLSGSDFSAAPLSASTETVFYVYSSDWTVTFDEPLSNVALYLVSWNALSYTFDNSFTILSGINGATQSGNTLTLSNESSGIIQFAGPISSLSIDISTNDPDLSSSMTFGIDQATVIDLSSFSAEATDSDPLAVEVAWETAAEIDNAGFNLHRSTSPDGPYTQINEALIAATGQPDAGQTYSFMDKPGSGTFFYKLEDIDIQGGSSWHGPVSVELSTPTAVSLNDLAQQESSKPYGIVITLALLGLVGLRKIFKFAR